MAILTLPHEPHTDKDPLIKPPFKQINNAIIVGCKLEKNKNFYCFIAFPNNPPLRPFALLAMNDGGDAGQETETDRCLGV